MPELFDFLFKEEEPTSKHPLLEIAGRNLQISTQAWTLNRFNPLKEHEAFYEQLHRAFPQQFTTSGQEVPEAVRELPLILTVCQKFTGDVPLDDYFVAIPINMDDHEEAKKIIKPGQNLVATMFGEFIGTVKKANLYTRFLDEKDKRIILSHIDPH